MAKAFKKSANTTPGKANNNPSGRRKRMMESEEEALKNKKSFSNPPLYSKNRPKTAKSGTDDKLEKRLIGKAPRKLDTREIKKGKSFKEFREIGIEKKSSDSTFSKKSKIAVKSTRGGNTTNPGKVVQLKRRFTSTEHDDIKNKNKDEFSARKTSTSSRDVRSANSNFKSKRDTKDFHNPSERKKPDYLNKLEEGDKRLKKVNTEKPLTARITTSAGNKVTVKSNKKDLAHIQDAGSGKVKSVSETTIRLNRFISNAGICSRRDADVLIQDGLIKVNGKVITELGYKVEKTDKIEYENKVLNRERQVYILLNKPKDFITTMDDPDNRKTVMHLVEKACEERVYPVGRLDRNTTGLLLLTNDGNLAATLTHPKHEVKKIYQVDLNQPLTEEDFEKIVNGVELEDGLVKVDAIEIISVDKKIIGLEIHEGRNRIVRRLFEHLGYEVVLLDRVMYAGLTKKDLPRGKYRMLTEKELVALKRIK